MGRRPVKRRLYSHEIAVVPNDPFVWNDGMGDIYLCNARCFCVWAVGFVTKPNFAEERKTGTFVMSTPTGEGAKAWQHRASRSVGYSERDRFEECRVALYWRADRSIIGNGDTLENSSQG